MNRNLPSNFRQAISWWPPTSVAVIVIVPHSLNRGWSKFFVSDLAATIYGIIAFYNWNEFEASNRLDSTFHLFIKSDWNQLQPWWLESAYNGTINKEAGQSRFCCGPTCPTGSSSSPRKSAIPILWPWSSKSNTLILMSCLSSNLNED